MKSISLLFLALSFALMGCQTNMFKQYEKIQVGQEKADVLEIMGSPLRSERYKGQDFWTYVFYTSDDTRYEKEVYFTNNKVTYVGEPISKIYKTTEKPLDVPSQLYGKPLQQPIAQDGKGDENPVPEEQKNISSKNSIQKYNDYNDYVNGYKEIRYAPEFKPIQ